MDDVLRSAQGGDQDGFAALVEEHESMVFSIALRYTGDRARAEEIAQEVFIQLYRSLREISTSEHLLFWLRQVTSRKCIDQKRRTRLRSVALDDAGPVSVDARESDPLLTRKLQASVAALPEAQRLAITLRYQEDLEPSEICRILGLSIS